jgi:tRNA threonylcarbamoyladenosine biosynthesis protein TsaE
VITLRSTSAEETKAVAGALAAVVRPGDVLLLAGEMGAGKTAFAQGLARGLGVIDVVTSPTFTLLHTYEGRYRVHHADVYRLERLGEVADLALGELADEDDAIVLVEWGDVVASALGGDLLTVQLEMVGPDEADVRVISVTANGGRWSARWPQVQSALASWVAQC